MKKKTTISLSVVIFTEGQHWIAQAIERDICAQGKDLDDVKARFEKTLDLELMLSFQNNDPQPLASVPVAPARFKQIFLDGVSKNHAFRPITRSSDTGRGRFAKDLRLTLAVA